MKNKIFALFISPLFILWGCGTSYDKLSKDELKNHEDEILNAAYAYFFNCTEYENGQRMNPPMVFDEVIVYCLNTHEQNYDLKALGDEEIDYEWDDLSIDQDDVVDMIESNVPIIQMSFHVWDPASQSGNNFWVSKTYFFPEMKFENNKITLGKAYSLKSRIDAINYFPYFNYDDPLNVPLNGGKWLDLNTCSGDIKVNYNGSIFKVSEFVKALNPTSSDLNATETISEESQGEEIVNQGDASSGNAVVVNSKAYFYENADASTQRKAYLVQGDNVNFSKRENGFIYVEFTNANNKTTKGWMLSTDFKFN